jgi:hypothetical protein
MPTPKTFTPAHAAGETFSVDPNGDVYVYRFGDQGQARDWLSRRRQAANGNFALPTANDLNDWALKQSSYGSQSEGVANNPFISVATDYESLFTNGEGWVQKILQSVPTLGVFLVPAGSLYRPSPTKSISKMETEWLYYDGQAPITDYVDSWQANPKKTV